VDDVVLEEQVLLDGVAHQATEERDVRARPQRHVDVRGRAGARVARVDVDDFRAALLGLHHPLEADGVILGHVGRDHDDIGVLDVDQVRRHRPATERGP